MKHRKIHIIGGAGSGKTFCANKLSKKYGISAYELDEIFWDNNANDYNTKTSEIDRNKKLCEVLESDSWIIEGAYYRWLSQSFKEADVIIILMPSLWIRHQRVILRFIKRKLGIIKSKNESFLNFWELVKWNHKFDSDNLIRIRDFISNYKGKTFVCKGYQDVLKII